MRDLVDELLEAKVKATLFGGEREVKLGRLVLLERLGRGASGTVFSAYDPRLERKVAVKVVEDADGVLREARALAKLAHPNVVAVHDAAVDDGAVHVVMELAPGVPLRAWKGEPRALVTAMRQVAAGLAAVHRAGLVHRDVKPDNVLIGDDRARLVDFGLAHDSAGSAGTPAYMAPEVLAGGAATAASDQFSFGATLYEAVYGRRPFAGARRDELRAAMKQPIEASDKAPAWLHAAIVRMLAVDPADRFGSMDAVVAALDRDRRRRGAYVLVAMAAVAGIAGGVALARGTSEPACSVPAVQASRIAGPWSERLNAALDANAAAWERSYAHVCEATRVRGEQSDRLLEVRMQCLDRARDRAAAFATALASASASERVAAVVGVQGLPDPMACESADGATAIDPRIVAARRQLDDAWAAYQLGRYKPARAALDAVTAGEPTDPAARELAAERLVLVGAIEGRTGGAADAQRDLQAAMKLAPPAVELDAWLNLLRVELFAGEPARVIEWEPFASAAAARAGHGQPQIDAILGEAYRDARHSALARDRLAHALTGDLRPDQRALVDMNLGSVALATGDLAAARDALTRAHALARRFLGDDHPELAIYLDKLAALARAGGDIAGALALHDHSLALRRAAFGDDDRAVATSLFHRGETLLEDNRLDDARADLERARAIRVKAFGDRSARLGEIDAALGEVAHAAGDDKEALARYAAAEAEDRRLDLATQRYRAGDTGVALAEPDELAINSPQRSALLRGPAEPDLSINSPQRSALLRGPAEPDLSIDAAERTAALVDRLVRAGDPVQARAIALRLRDRWLAAPKPVHPALSCAVGDALARVGEDAHPAFQAALDALADQPSRTRARARAGL